MAIQIIITDNNRELNIKECTNFINKFLCFMFRKKIEVNEGIVFLYDKESIINSAIHMLFMRFPITVIWVNAENIIVDKKLAKPWRLVYRPCKPANVIYELNATIINEFNIGDKIYLKHEN